MNKFKKIFVLSAIRMTCHVNVNDEDNRVGSGVIFVEVGGGAIYGSVNSDEESSRIGKAVAADILMDPTIMAHPVSQICNRVLYKNLELFVDEAKKKVEEMNNELDKMDDKIKAIRAQTPHYNDMVERYNAQLQLLDKAQKDLNNAEKDLNNAEKELHSESKMEELRQKFLKDLEQNPDGLKGFEVFKEAPDFESGLKKYLQSVFTTPNSDRIKSGVFDSIYKSDFKKWFDWFATIRDGNFETLRDFSSIHDTNSKLAVKNLVLKHLKVAKGFYWCGIINLGVDIMTMNEFRLGVLIRIEGSTTLNGSGSLFVKYSSGSVFVSGQIGGGYFGSFINSANNITNWKSDFKNSVLMGYFFIGGLNFGCFINNNFYISLNLNFKVYRELLQNDYSLCFVIGYHS